MKFPEFTDDLSIVSKLGDNPGADNGLTAEGLKAKFDEGPLALQRFLNSVLIAKLNEIFVAGGQLNDGLIMTGPINMNQNMLFGLADPRNDSEAVSLGFANNKYVPKSRTVNGKALSDDITLSAANVDAAPAGYGLGTSSVQVSDLNTCLTNGWYWTGEKTANSPITYSAVHVRTRLDGQVVQTLFGMNALTGCQVNRHTLDGGATWIEEWINPPMVPGKKYRTTKRHNGKPVYAMAIDGGALPNATSTSVGTTIPEDATVISAIGVCNDSGVYAPLPFVSYNGDITCKYFLSASKNIQITTYTDMSAYTCQFVFEYTID